MKRLVFAAAAMLALSACTPAAVDPNDPWAALEPWNHSRADVEKLPSGVEYVIVRKGDGKGPNPGPRDEVEVNYEGRLASNGQVFDWPEAEEDGETKNGSEIEGIAQPWRTAAGSSRVVPDVYWKIAMSSARASSRDCSIPSCC